MQIHQFFWLGLSPLLLVACSATPPRNGTTYDKINAELIAASQSKANQSKADASAQEAVNAALLPPLRVGLPNGEGKTIEQRFDLKVSGAPVDQVFMGIVSGTKYSMLVHPEVTGAISVNLRDVTVFEALDAIRDMYGYGYSVNGNRIQIQPLTMQTRIYKVNYLTGRRTGGSDLRVNSGSISSSGAGSSGGTSGTGSAGGGQTLTTVESSNVYTVFRSDFWGDMENALRTVIGCQVTRSSVAGGGTTSGISGAPTATQLIAGGAVSGRGVEGCEGGRSVSVNPLSGVVVVRALPSEQREVSTFLKLSQVSVDRQVILEAKILDVELSDSYQAGVNWAGIANSGRNSMALGRSSSGFTAGHQGTNTGINLNTSVYGVNGNGINTVTSQPSGALDGATLNPLVAMTSGVFGIAFANQNFATMIEFLQTQGNVQVLSSPRISTLNNQKAVLKVGIDQFFVTNVSSTSTSVGTTSTSTPSVTLQPFFSGIALDVTPQIDDNNNIILHIHPSVSNVETVSTTIDLGAMGQLVLPLAASNVSETDSVVRARDGQIVAIGGLMKQVMVENRSGVPGVSDVPYLGGLLRNTAQGSVKKELVILLKPTVIQGDDGWVQDIADAQGRVETMNRGFSYGGRSQVFGVGAERQNAP
ncbi:MAG: pilus (MSHA type) biogenesis protein MshL [Sulfuricellaceae bacterium]|nr:pilus (MSHA type) biogenesis protein MshL [Sulfuricellaceae bacterium]